MTRPQILTLTLSGTRAPPPGGRAAFEFRQRGGSIGRSEECDWVFASPGVSRTHAVVRYLDGLYFVEDRSTNGLLLNGAPLARSEPAMLSDGDRLQLDTYQIEVALRDEAGAQAEATFMAAPAAAVPPPAPAPARSPPLPPPPVAAPSPRDGAIDALLGGLDAAGDELDPLRLFEAPSPPPAAAPEDAGWHHGPASADHFRPPRPLAPAPVLPEAWDLTSGDFAAAPAAPDAAAPAQGADLDALLAAPPPEPPAAAALAGLPAPAELDRIFGIVVDGVMEVLRARAEIKNTFRLPVTLIQRSENNPLKFAATPDEAMRKLAQADGAFLSGADAFEDAFDDIRCHQMAMLAGMRAAFESLLFHFNPDRLEREADSAGRRAFAGKARYWARYREQFERAVADPDECFRMLFGDEFARAYEAQLARLKSARRGRQRG